MIKKSRSYNGGDNMTGISGIHDSGYYTRQIASGKKINSASDDAAGLAIVNKINSNSNAQKVNADNDRSGINAMNIADGALGGITDYLDRIKELSVKASNGLLSQSDKQAIQNEIDENIKGIDQITGTAQFNTKKLLTGEDMSIASNPDGSGINVGVGVATSEALGLKGYSVMGDIDMSVIDDALGKVSSMRSSAGASTNSLEYAYNYSRLSAENLDSASSRIEDVDVAKAISEQKKNSLLEQYRVMAQKKQVENENMVNKMLTGI